MMEENATATNKHGNKFEKQLSLQDLFNRRKSQPYRTRSNSDGAKVSLTYKADAFPSLPNTVLEKLGLYGDAIREPLTEQSLEQKFTSLSLAFTIDATTIKDRCERQRRTRDQTESNFNLEVDRLKEKLVLLQPLCTDFETADLLQNLFSQVDTLTSAAALVAIAAERYGAVQHEDRLTESVQLMVSHVQGLKQQRDQALRQLQYTKRVLHEPISANAQGVHKNLLNKRRASTDSVNFAQIEPKLNRRISDLYRNRPRSDFTELNKIKEIVIDDIPKEPTEEEQKEMVTQVSEPSKDDVDSDFESCPSTKTDYRIITNEICSIIKLKISSYSEIVHKKFLDVGKRWSETGYLHAFLNSCAILCFSVSILTLTSIFLEQEYTKSSTKWLVRLWRKN